MATQATPNGDLLIAHISDTHLRDSQYAAARRGQDFFDGFLNAVGVALEAADVICITGDIFDRPRPSSSVVAQLMEIDLRIRRAGKVAFAITGNHDWMTPTWLQTLFPGRVLGPTDDGVETLRENETGIVPMDNSSAVFRGYRFVGLTPHSGASFRNELANITVQVRKADVVLFHALVDGVVKFPIHIPEPLHVSELPISKQNSAWLLGDIHTQGYVERDRPGGGKCLVGYSASTEMCSASEPVEKSVPIIRLNADGAKLERTIPFRTRPFINASVHTAEQLDALMGRITAVADQHPVVVVQFDRQLPQTINRLHSTLDAQRAIIRCYPLPEVKTSAARETDSPDAVAELTMEHFVSRRFEDRPDLQKVALDLLARGEDDAGAIIGELIESQLVTHAVREND
jgi:DNA repair exonuclease SbcCD nuclease subunit